MKGVVWLGVALFVSSLSLINTLDPGEQAKVATALDTAQFFINALNDDVAAQTKVIKDAIKVSDGMASVDLLNKQAKLTKIGSTVGRALKAIQGASAVASFIFTFFMPSDLDVITGLINERFKEVNSKLDNLDAKLDAIEVSIKANTAFNTFLATWISWEYASKNGAKKLKDIRIAMSTTNQRVQKVKLAEEYINYYDNNNLDGNLMNLYRMAALPDSTTNRNIFDRFIAEYGCDIGKMSQLMLIIQNVMTSAAQQKLTYYYLKGDSSRARDGFNDIQTYFFDIRRAFDDRVWSCRSSSLTHAKNDAKNMLKTTNGQGREAVANAIFKELKVKYPWYTWAVAAAKSDRTQILGLEWRGTTYFTVDDRTDPDNVKSYYIVYEDTKAYTGCSEITQARTLLVFKRCDGCNSDYIYASDNILSGKKCPSTTLEQLVSIKDELLRGRDSAVSCSSCTNSQISAHFARRQKRSSSSSDNCVVSTCVSRLKTEIESWDYIASAVNINYAVCEADTCSGNGQCKSISFTTTHQCICNRNYEGESCEKLITFDDTIEKLMSELRLTFNVVNGVPTAVDIFFNIQSLSQKLNVMLQNIRSSFAHTNNIIQHSQIIYNVEDIVDLYSKLQKNELSFSQFGSRIDGYLKTITQFELQNRLRKMILGQGTLDTPGNDIYNSYKREYASLNGAGCSAQYNTDVEAFRDNLSYLDQALGEALLLHKKWLLDTKGTTTALQNAYKQEAKYVSTIFEGRQKEFNDYWKSYSCGPISVSGTNVDCKSEFTFDGMAINLQCDQQRRATPSTLTCKRVNGALQWDSQPVCKFVWGSFGAWSSCSKTCDGGLTYSYRSCLGTTNIYNCVNDQGGLHYQYRQCNTQPCCAAQYSKFKCSNNRCIWASTLCDGYDNCGNGDDESRSRCPNIIRSGDRMALENNARRGHWLSCYCTVNCGWDRCKVQTCPGSTMDESDWSPCSSERFRIWAIDKSSGQAIHHGDRLAVQYAWDYSKGTGSWLSCWVSGSHCRTRTCPGSSWSSTDTANCRGEYFWIFSPDRRGGCSSDILKGCRGKPIQQGDTVFILYGTPSWFLSEDDGDIRTRPCPGQYVEQSDKSGCSHEAWRIFH